MTNQNNAAQAAMLRPIDEAIVILTEEAAALRECHTPSGDRDDWTGESEAKGAHDNMMRVADALSKLRAPVVDEPPGGTRWPVLRAMARNYTAGKHTWDALDANACEQAAEEIRHLRAALASAPAANDLTPAGMKEICPECGHQFGCFHSPYIDKLRALASVPVADERAAFDVVASLEPPCATRRGNDFREGYLEAKADALRLLRTMASAPVAGEVVAWAAVPSRGKRAGRIYTTCDTRKEIDAYIEQVHQSNDSLTLSARPLSFADAAPQASAEAFDFVAHLARQAEFSARTFGPGARVAGVCDHIRKELIEVEASGGDLKEWVDVIILGLDGAWRSGATPQEIIAAIVAKQAKNEARTWPDWRTVDPTKAIEHDRGGQP